jgi:hypothetical protein
VTVGGSAGAALHLDAANRKGRSLRKQIEAGEIRKPRGPRTGGGGDIANFGVGVLLMRRGQLHRNGFDFGVKTLRIFRVERRNDQRVGDEANRAKHDLDQAQHG